MNARAPGMTLVELMVTAVIGSIVLMAVHQTLSIQERSSRQQRAMVVAQQNSRIALELLTAEIREISAAGGDLIEADSQSMTFRGSRKLGFVCATNSVDGQIDIWQRGIEFETGDSLFLFVDSDTATSADDQWVITVAAAVDSIGYSLDCPEWEVGEDDALPIQRITLANDSIVHLIGRGSPVRSYDLVTYELGQVSGEWKLGRSTGTTFLPLVGPLVPGGVQFEYLDVDGNSFAPDTPAKRAAVSRIRITVRALAPGAIGMGPMENQLETQLYLRNR